LTVSQNRLRLAGQLTQFAASLQLLCRRQELLTAKRRRRNNSNVTNRMA
jgi:hypothetical protein